MNKKYAYFFKGYEGPFILEITNDMTVAESRTQITSFLGKTNPSYLDKYGIIHEVYGGKDQPYVYIFEVQDDDFYEVIGVLGEYLDEHSDKHPQEESVRKAIAEVYDRLLPIAEGKELIANERRIKYGIYE